MKLLEKRLEILKSKGEILNDIILSLYTGDDYSILNNQIDLIDDLGFDSITLIQLVVMLEDEFNMTFPDELFSMEYLRSYKYLKNYICGETTHGN